MLRSTRWLFAVVGAVLLWRFGISIARAPEHEILYAAGRPLRTCVPENCVTMLNLEVGNTGTAAQSDVRVRFRAAPLAGLALPMKVRNFGKVDRAVEVEEEDGVLVYRLGRLEPQKRVTFEVTFLGPASEPLPTWDALLVAVEPAEGEASPGDPAGVLFLRMMHALFGWL